LFTGCPANATIGNLMVSYAGESIVVASSSGFIDTELPDQGPSSVSAITYLYRELSLYNMKCTDREDLAKRLLSCKPDTIEGLIGVFEK